MTKTACIVYGVMEGHLHGWRMRRELRKRGYALVKNPREAQVIVAHSGGYLIVPKLQASQTLLMIDPACHNERPPLMNVAHHVVLDIRQVLWSRDFLFYFWKTGLNLLYLVVRFKPIYRMSKIYSSGGRPELLHRPKTIIVQGDDTSWLNREELAGATVHYLRSWHDDCWLYPERYLDFLNRPIE